MAGDPRITIRDVWAHNLDAELDQIRAIVDDYPCIAMDTEFPGVVIRPFAHWTNVEEYQYQLVRINVDALKIIQLGLTFSDRQGNLRPGASTWQFHFRFSLAEDMYAHDSIALLQRSGIDFGKLDQYGIVVDTFAELLVSSGIVLNEDVTWISFHGGYDFAYLLRMMINQPLPKTFRGFNTLVGYYFPTLYDIKVMTQDLNLGRGLADVAASLQVGRVGPAHQAGSDALLTCQTFHQLVNQHFPRLLESHSGSDTASNVAMVGSEVKNQLFGLRETDTDPPLDDDDDGGVDDDE